MRKTIYIMMLVVFVAALSACNKNDTEELPSLEVDFSVPETADPGDTVTLIAKVIYNGKPVTDASEMNFEIWEQGNQDDGETIDAENNGDGTYTLDYTFDKAGIYEMYAHTTAHAIHTMPKRQINVGNTVEADDSEHHEDGFHTEGFGLDFKIPEGANAGEQMALTTHLTLHHEALEDATVQYEIWTDDSQDKVDWVEAPEKEPGEYTGEYEFPAGDTYFIQVHVRDKADLHEHQTFEVEVKD